MNKYLLIITLAVVMSVGQTAQAILGDLVGGAASVASAPLGRRAYYGPGYYAGSRSGYFNEPYDWYNDGYYDRPGFGVYID